MDADKRFRGVIGAVEPLQAKAASGGGFGGYSGD